MKLILSEDEKRSILERTFRIRAVGNEINRNWELEETRESILRDLYKLRESIVEKRKNKEVNEFYSQILNQQNMSNRNLLGEETSESNLNEFSPILAAQRDLIQKINKDTECRNENGKKILGGFDEILDKQQIALARLRKIDEDHWRRILGR